jgi:hypothetical protein
MPWFDPWKRAVQHSLQQRDEVIPVQFAITEDDCEQTRTDSLTCVDGHDRASAIGVTKEVVAALDSRNLEPRLPQGGDDFSSRDPGKSGHATVIF